MNHYVLERNCVVNKKEKQVSWLEQIKKPGNMLCMILAVIMIIGLFVFGTYVNRDRDEVDPSSSQLDYAKAVVTNVLEDDAQPDHENAEGRRVGTQELEIRVTSGKRKGEIMPVTNYMSAMFNIDVEQGDHVVIRVMTDEDGSYYASLFNYDRGLIVGGFILLFCITLAILGGKKGIGALLGLIFTISVIWWILIPSVIHGFSPIVITISTIAITAAASLLLLNGVSKKTLCAILGCVFGVMTAGGLAAIVTHLTPMNGFNMSEAENLILYGADKGMKISGLLVCGVLISALGAVMDVAMSIASSIYELHDHDPNMTVKQLFVSGMHIGRDAMGTMANTLILAFAGSSLNMLILVQTYNIPFLQLVNTDYICIEVIQSVAGSMGILLTVPIVAVISSTFIGNNTRTRSK